MGSFPRNITRILLSQSTDSRHDMPISSNGDHGSVNTGDLLTLNSDTSHYLKTVLKKKSGDPVVVIDDRNNRGYSATIQEVAPAVTLAIKTQLDLPPSISRVRTVACALLKGDHNEIVCEKACELGVNHLIFWRAHRSIVVLDESKTKKRLERLQKIARSATQQSANLVLPTVTLIESTQDLVTTLLRPPYASALTLFCSLREKSEELRTISPPPVSCNLIVGPEGDFDNDEEALLLRSGFFPLSLGPAILRSETAAITAIASANAVWGFIEKE